MKNHLFSSDEEQNGGRRSAYSWWRTADEFDENGHFKIDVSEFSNLTPRYKILREMERLAFIATDGLDDLRHKLLSYRAGDFWLPIGGLKKEDMDIPPVVTILLAGLTASGKSSFTNLMYSVLGRSGLIPFAQTSGESSNYTTMFLEEHNVLRSPRSGLCVYDTRGLDKDEMEEGLDEVSTWMSVGVRHNQPCHRPGDGDKSQLSDELTNSRYLRRKVNCVMVVADLSQIHRSFKCGDLNSMEALRDLFHLSAVKNSNENPILILTHGDKLNAEERINGRLRICEYLGIPETSGAYDIPCMTEQGIMAEESDPVTAFSLTEAVYRALLQSDRTHLPKKKFKDWLIFFCKWIMWCIACLFVILANFFSKFGHHNKKLKM
ncbi:hypothetical protein MIMGU_mgv1a008330mg [Erythranthe guttata]|uniref:G domain-containing protein n=1 Tax=Erythranthe guttata TaxID=4155 RepID=A0A022RVC7_ERYGU|nr:PREDICTED: uncharacterized protein LOC105948977 [Erythranthe guttata]EYU43999.1 hypothetical protein MIMGU_mgv1a008330mg [Erythranthe guttata]|eukprot:XP_012827697.1 PREDICTED: uncharacterized protein LOC105948977 [Erythranthe guttata]